MVHVQQLPFSGYTISKNHTVCSKGVTFVFGVSRGLLRTFDTFGKSSRLLTFTFVLLRECVSTSCEKKQKPPENRLLPCG